LNIFNPEHDLCLANGSPNFVPPDSALEFGRNCKGLTRWIEEADQGQIVPWGWNPYLKRQLQKQGVPDPLLPSDRQLADIRALSHRRTAIKAREYLDTALRQYKSHLTAPASVEMTSVGDISAALETLGSVVLKAPWSGSGKGLRWVRSGEFFPSDEGWCRRTIARQGSVIADKRFEVIRDFAMLFSVCGEKVNFEGLSLFHNENGMYRGNLLSSDAYITYVLSRYVPEELLEGIKVSMISFIREHFAGKYSGYLGVDMFISSGDGGRYLINPCVEINVRMTMGLLARKVFDRFRDRIGEGTHSLSVEYRPGKGEITKFVHDSSAIPLHELNEENRYAVVIIKNIKA